MITRFARMAAVSLLAAIVACGTVVEQPHTGSGGAGGTGGAGGASTTGSVTASSSSSGTASSGSGGGGCDEPAPAACPTTAQCVTPTIDCTCNGSPGAWSCSSSDGPTGLPGSAPADGSCCTEEGMFCGGFDPCGAICHCTGGAWSCKTPVACPPATCPTPVETLNGEACPTRIGEVCEGTGFCHYTCICKLDASGSASWECTIPPC